jgi:O-Antigen ligase
MLASNGMRLTRELRSPLTPALALTAGALFFGGGLGDSSLPWLGAAALLLALGLFATQSTPSGLPALLPLAALAAWSAVTVDWSIEPDRSWSYANRAFVYLAFAVVGALVGAEPRRLLYGFAALLGAVCVWSLAGKVLPWLYEDYGRMARLRGPVGYWNSLSLLGDVALPIGLCLATRRRVAGTLLVYGWLVAIGLTYSRGGVIVAVIVVGLWMALSRAWLEALSTLLAAGIPAAGALAVAFSLPGLTSDGQAHVTRVREGLVFGAVLLVDAAIAAALTRFPLPPASAPALRRAGLGLLVVCVAGAVALGATRARSWWHSFTSPSSGEITNSSGHLLSSGSNFRWDWWTQAWRGWKTAPLKGTGAGSFGFTNLRYRSSDQDTAIEPHDLPVQFLSETGLVGLALFAVSVGWLVVRGRRRPGPQLALALALPAYFLHGLLDIDWDFAAVTAPVFLIAGALAVRASGRPRPRAFTVVTASGAALAVGSSLFAVWLGNRWNDQAGNLLQVNDARAVQLAQRSRSVDPLSVQPLYTAALAEIDLAAGLRHKDPAGYRAANSLALGYYTKATEIQPDDADAWYSLGYYDYEVRGCARAAYDAFNRTTVLDGKNLNYIYYYDLTLKKVNSGKPKC